MIDQAEKLVVIQLPDTATPEQLEVIDVFATMLVAVTSDGGKKRAAKLKPSWKIDTSHRAAVFSHLNKREHGELKDPDSGMHPYVHLAWRALAIAWQESHSIPRKEWVSLHTEAGLPVPKEEEMCQPKFCCADYAIPGPYHATWCPKYLNATRFID